MFLSSRSSATRLPEDESGASRRVGFIDLLRGVALLFMVVDHAYDWWLIEADNLGRWGRTTEFIGTLAAPIFLILVGVSMALGTDSRRSQGVMQGRIATGFLRRGLIVALWGYAINLLVFFTGSNWADLWSFDVLHCIGIGMILLTPVAVWAPTWTLPLFALALGWGGQYADRLLLPGYLGTAVNGIPPIAYFPLLPWLCFVLSGILWGRALARWRNSRVATNRLALMLVPIGLVFFVGAAFVPVSLGYRYPYAMTILFDGGVICWLGAFLYAVCRRSWGCQVLGWLRKMGRETLMLYVLHHLVGIRLFLFFGWVTGRSWRGHFGVFNSWQATLLLVVFWVFLVLATRGWMALRRRYPGFDRVVRHIL